MDSRQNGAYSHADETSLKSDEFGDGILWSKFFHVHAMRKMVCWRALLFLYGSMTSALFRFFWVSGSALVWRIMDGLPLVVHGSFVYLIAFPISFCDRISTTTESGGDLSNCALVEVNQILQWCEQDAVSFFSRQDSDVCVRRQWPSDLLALSVL